MATKPVARGYVPLLGQALAAGLSFSAMKLLGNSHIDDCYRRGQRGAASNDRAGRRRQRRNALFIKIFCGGQSKYLLFTRTG
ncbi:hypothetical protein [Sodalis sp. (in: enterobacteria)]|uniref:hypothetical protein n=1 Tax=Sodalis sp. (in: enterobacteria) TaxID=1898979 RepID=UPI003F6886A4